MKKIIALCLALVLVFQGAGAACAAEAEPLAFGLGKGILPAWDVSAPAGDTASRSYAMAMARLATRLREYDGSAERFEVRVDIPFDVPREDVQTYFDTLFLHTVREYPEFFWVDLGRRENGWDSVNKEVVYGVYVLPEFLGEAFQRAQEALEHEILAALAEIIRPDMSDAEKILSAYGWMKQNIRYDQAAGWDAYSAYSALVNRRAVCHGCAVTLGLLLKRAGVECYTVLSHVEGQELYHIWCAVKCGGKWYNLDPTAGNVPGCLSYDKFLRSTGEMLSGGSYIEHETRLHVSCEEPYPGDILWKYTNQSFLYSDKYQGLVNVENCMDQNGTIYLAYEAKYRVVTIDEEGKAESQVIATIPSTVVNATQEFEDRIYYISGHGALRSFCISTGEDISLSSEIWKDSYVALDEVNRCLLILDGEGKTRSRVVIP